jgi:hypothetical protein
MTRRASARPREQREPRHRPPGHHRTTAAMDITKFVAEHREAAFLVGDYGTYRAQLSRRLRIVRKKLGRATAKNAKYTARAPVTAEEVGTNVEYECSVCRRGSSC